MADIRLNAAQYITKQVPRRSQNNGRHYLWDSTLVDTVTDNLFNPKAWEKAGQLTGQASGRGAAWFLRPGDNQPWVLRHSRRGGIVANVNDDSYLWLGASRCRVFREFDLLTILGNHGLPVPRPVAARGIRQGIIYTGDLITVQIPNARPLADRLADASLDGSGWREIGITIARFHAAGAYHHDLNARNILLDAANAATLIDFDKSAIRKPGSWREGNLQRLRRSLDKITSQNATIHFAEQDWQNLLAGYNSHLQDSGK